MGRGAWRFMCLVLAKAGCALLGHSWSAAGVRIRVGIARRDGTMINGMVCGFCDKFVPAEPPAAPTGANTSPSAPTAGASKKGRAK
jgi:hypothetical protein